ncbi:hypothetical protein B9Z55_013022 [Caenorhabditis nigoni]|uniref:Uncharacterized protein n=1 Tax=Caenorhabditis nigoni TaxID=1611254 RepID=A0A2G5U005_9PELO|nr:hypothetical protein B9Z55_013022 [Caenorhabditis nigoni]
MKTTLLVASEEVDKYHKDHNLAYSWDNVERVGGPPAINVETYHHHEEAPPVKASAYDVPPLNPHYVPSYATQSHQQHEQHSQPPIIIIIITITINNHLH